MIPFKAIIDTFITFFVTAMRDEEDRTLGSSRQPSRDDPFQAVSS